MTQNVGEKGVETALAALAESDELLLGEAADLLFHHTVLLRSRGLSLRDVKDVLRRPYVAAGTAMAAPRMASSPCSIW